MKEYFCLMCEHVWMAPQADHCPECGREDIATDDWYDEDGHFEGDMGGLKSDQDHHEE